MLPADSSHYLADSFGSVFQPVAHSFSYRSHFLPLPSRRSHQHFLTKGYHFLIRIFNSSRGTVRYFRHSRDNRRHEKADSSASAFFESPLCRVYFQYVFDKPGDPPVLVLCTPASDSAERGCEGMMRSSPSFHLYYMPTLREKQTGHPRKAQRGGLLWRSGEWLPASFRSVMPGHGRRTVNSRITGNCL